MRSLSGDQDVVTRNLANNLHVILSAVGMKRVCLGKVIIPPFLTTVLEV